MKTSALSTMYIWQLINGLKMAERTGFDTFEL